MLRQSCPSAPAPRRSRRRAERSRRSSGAHGGGSSRRHRRGRRPYDHVSPDPADVWNAERRAEETADPGSRTCPATPRSEIAASRERLALAHLLIARPTSWLLDEPTNHLDDEAAAYVAAAIAEHPGPVLIASHDRAFLDDATSAQLDLDPAESPLGEQPGGLTAYTGTFSDYLLARYEARDR